MIPLLIAFLSGGGCTLDDINSRLPTITNGYVFQSCGHARQRIESVRNATLSENRPMSSKEARLVSAAEQYINKHCKGD